MTGNSLKTLCPSVPLLRSAEFELVLKSIQIALPLFGSRGVGGKPPLPARVNLLSSFEEARQTEATKLVASTTLSGKVSNPELGSTSGVLTVKVPSSCGPPCWEMAVMSLLSNKVGSTALPSAVLRRSCSSCLVRGIAPKIA